MRIYDRGKVEDDFQKCTTMFFVKRANFHDYTFFEQFNLIIQHIFTEHIAGQCEVLAMQNLRRQDLSSQGPAF